MTFRSLRILLAAAVVAVPSAALAELIENTVSVTVSGVETSEATVAIHVVRDFTEVPTVGELGLAVLALALTFAAVSVLRRHRPSLGA